MANVILARTSVISPLFKLKGSRSVFKSTHKELVGTRVDTLKSDLALLNSSVNAVRSSGVSLSTSGAARGEQLETDGYGFYMAAKSGDRVAVSKAAFTSLRNAI
jgi:hypothetical protein